MAASEDDRIRISKRKDAKNYRSWTICVQAALEDKAMWEIVDGTTEKHILLAINDT